MDCTSGSSYSGIGFCGILAVAFIVLKLTHVIAWSWWWVLAPLWILPALFCALVAVVLMIAAVVRRSRKKKEEERAEAARASMNLTFEKNIPLPPAQPGAEEVVPELAAMRVGESILIPNLPGKKHPPVLAVSVLLYGYRADKRFETQYLEDGLRVWRRK